MLCVKISFSFPVLNVDKVFSSLCRLQVNYQFKIMKHRDLFQFPIEVRLYLYLFVATCRYLINIRVIAIDHSRSFKNKLSNTESIRISCSAVVSRSVAVLSKKGRQYSPNDAVLPSEQFERNYHCNFLLFFQTALVVHEWIIWPAHSRVWIWPSLFPSLGCIITVISLNIYVTFLEKFNNSFSKALHLRSNLLLAY